MKRNNHKKIRENKMSHKNKIGIVVLSLLLTSCAVFNKRDPLRGNARNAESTEVVMADKNKSAHERASNLTSGWPDSSVTAAKEMVVRYGEPTEVTRDALIWKNLPVFKRIIVHREVYSNRFPLLHQTPLEHVVNYDAKENRVEEVWKYDGSVVFDRTRGEVTVSGENESMNILSLNLAHSIMQGKMSPSQARIENGKETMNFLNGNRTAMTQALQFGNQINTSDAGETITKKIRWEGETGKQRNLRQAQEDISQ